MPTTAAAPQHTTVSSPGGTIDVAFTATTLAVVAIHPASGFEYDIGGASTTHPNVHFETTGTELYVLLTLQNGHVSARVEYDS
jgi:hypothetical protein